MQTPPPAAVPTRNVGPATAPTQVGEHAFGTVIKVDVSLFSRYWSGNMHRPKAVQASVTFGPPQRKQTRTVILQSPLTKDVPEGTEVFICVYRILMPNIQRPDEAIVLRAGPEPDAVVTAWRKPKETAWAIPDYGQGRNWNMLAIIDQYMRGRSHSPSKRTGNSPNRAGGTPRGSPSRSGAAHGSGGAR